MVQTSWWPESTHGGIYELLGDKATVDTNKKIVRGPLVSGGVDTGVQLEIRPGGPARGQQPVADLMKADPSITFGQQATEEQVLGWAQGIPTVGVIAPFYVDPVVFIWDRKLHPDWNTIQDVGQTNTTVYTFHSANADYLLGSGILRASQVNYSYDGSPALFMAKPDSVVGGFATNEPFIYRSLGRDVDYAYVADTGYPDYRNVWTIHADQQQKLAPCLRKLVPMMQQAMIDFVSKPARTLARIVQLNTQYKASFPYPQPQAEYGVQTMKQDGLVSDPKSGGFGAFDASRNSRMIDILRPIYAAQHQSVPGDLTADSIATNAYIDPSIRMGS
ncbi:MAG TPA: ABC transporter substrate-binding protein [Mycobacteriales bacterium]|nr:ABC transporter substrate-binding protein [Mycobacteriales bacterium]